MSFKCFCFKMLWLSSALFFVGCAGSVQDIEINDSALIGSAQLNYHHSSGKVVTQLEFQSTKIDDKFLVNAAVDSRGVGEQRLRDTSATNLPENQFIGVGEVTANYQMQQVTARSLFKVNNRERFQLYLAPELTLMQLDSKYISGQRHIDIDTEKFGAGMTVVGSWRFMKQFSANASGSFNIYENESWRILNQIFVRFQPDKRFYVDAGVYSTFFVVANDRISLESRVIKTYPCIGGCEYAYDGSQNSDVEFDLKGFRMGIGVDF
jgi:hypothetical protein